MGYIWAPTFCFCISHPNFNVFFFQSPPPQAHRRQSLDVPPSTSRVRTASVSGMPQSEHPRQMIRDLEEWQNLEQEIHQLGAQQQQQHQQLQRERLAASIRGIKKNKS